jgi:hypothetical protein
MILKLTHYQARVVMSRIPEMHKAAMLEHRVVHGPKAHRYDLPAIAWRQIRDHLWLNPAYYGPQGGKLDSQPKALYRAIQLIHTAVLSIEHHPALVRGAVIGHQPQIIPAWRSWEGSKYGPNSPYPPGEFFLLVPQMLQLHGVDMTEWRYYRDFVGDGWSWTYQEAAHLAFMGVAHHSQS